MRIRCEEGRTLFLSYLNGASSSSSSASSSLDSSSGMSSRIRY